MSETPPPPANFENLDPELWAVTYRLCTTVRVIKRREHGTIARQYCPLLKDAAKNLGVSYQRAADLIVDTGKRMIRFGEIRSVHPTAYLLGATSDPGFAEFARLAPTPEEAIRGWAEVMEARTGRPKTLRRD